MSVQIVNTRRFSGLCSLEVGQGPKRLRGRHRWPEGNCGVRSKQRGCPTVLEKLSPLRCRCKRRGGGVRSRRMSGPQQTQTKSLGRHDHGPRRLTEWGNFSLQYRLDTIALIFWCMAIPDQNNAISRFIDKFRWQSGIIRYQNLLPATNGSGPAVAENAKRAAKSAGSSHTYKPCIDQGNGLYF